MLPGEAHSGPGGEEQGDQGEFQLKWGRACAIGTSAHEALAGEKIEDWLEELGYPLHWGPN